MHKLFANTLLSTSALALLLSAGCAQQSSPNGAESGATPTDAAAAPADQQAHGGWWCDEHGVPEGVCGLCDSKLAAELQKKGDWCQEHDRPDSQCFVCHPELEATFAAQYEAKYGKKPPKPAG